ncbi:GIY-YIG nuclease family protein [Atopobacter phocae]|uniref:GIY-YIG nuclease family protein n=1 Tax=Atopobacter phocae TaxID=136492 RepID=UPI000472A1AB|nr:GIY-YIG nuclease family protein [Atopobacter phocae]
MKPEKVAYFYVLVCKDRSFYAGYTTNLTNRVNTHNSGQGAKYTRARRPVHLIYAEQWANSSQAMKQEYWFKQLTRNQKERYLVEQGVTPPFNSTTSFMLQRMSETHQNIEKKKESTNE